MELHSLTNFSKCAHKRVKHIIFTCIICGRQNGFLENWKSSLTLNMLQSILPPYNALSPSLSFCGCLQWEAREIDVCVCVCGCVLTGGISGKVEKAISSALIHLCQQSLQALPLSALHLSQMWLSTCCTLFTLFFCSFGYWVISLCHSTFLSLFFPFLVCILLSEAEEKCPQPLMSIG